MSNKINLPAIKILGAVTLSRGAKNMFGIFLNVYLWKETHDVQLLAIFNMCFLTFHMLGYFSLSFFVKAWNRKYIHYILVGGHIFVYTLCVIFSEYIIQMPFLLAALYGFFNGGFYMNVNTIQFDLTNLKNRGNYEGLKKSLKVGSKVIFPVFFGYIISQYSIELGFFIGILLFFGTMYIGGLDYKYNSGKLNYGDFYTQVRQNSFLGEVFFISVLVNFAFSFSLLEFLIPMMIYIESDSELSLGVSLSIISIFSMGVLWGFGKFVDYKHYNKSIWITTVIYIGSIVGLLYVESQMLFLLFASLVGSFIYLYMIPYSVITTNALHGLKDYKNYIVEYSVFKEVGYYLGWMIGFAILYFGKDFTQEGVSTVLYIMIVGAMISSIFLVRMKMHVGENE